MPVSKKMNDGLNQIEAVFKYNRPSMMRIIGSMEDSNSYLVKTTYGNFLNTGGAWKKMFNDLK